MNNDIIVFCQAPADIPYFLTLYERNKKDKTFCVYVINIENVYKFLKSLNLELKNLIFIPYTIKSFKNIPRFLEERRRIKRIKAKYFNDVRDADVYFFSRFEDWLTSSFLKTLQKQNSVHYFDHYDFSSKLYKEQKINFKLLVLKILYYILTDVNFKVAIIEKLPEFNYRKYNIKRQTAELDSNIFHKYSFTINVKENLKPIVLLFVSPCEGAVYNCKSHDEIQFQIIELLKKCNMTIVVKGHPRSGIPENIINLIDVQIESYIPAEFIEVENVSMCLGVITAALAHFAKNTKIQTYSLINLFEFKDVSSIIQYKDYLSELSNNEISILKLKMLLDKE